MRNDEEEIKRKILVALQKHQQHKFFSKKIIQALKRQQTTKFFDKDRLFFSAFSALVIVVCFIWESQPRINISKLEIQHNFARSSGKNIRINFELKTAHLEGHKCNAIVYFYHENGRKVRSTIPGYQTRDNQLSVGRRFRPRYQYSIYKKRTLYMPNRHFNRGNYKGKVTAYCGDLWANKKTFNFSVSKGK